MLVLHRTRSRTQVSGEVNCMAFLQFSFRRLAFYSTDQLNNGGSNGAIAIFVEWIFVEIVDILMDLRVRGCTRCSTVQYWYTEFEF